MKAVSPLLLSLQDRYGACVSHDDGAFSQIVGDLGSEEMVILFSSFSLLLALLLMSLLCSAFAFLFCRPRARLRCNLQYEEGFAQVSLWIRTAQGNSQRFRESAVHGGTRDTYEHTHHLEHPDI